MEQSSQKSKSILTTLLFILFLIPLTHILAGSGGGGGAGGNNNSGDNTGYNSSGDDNSGYGSSGDPSSLEPGDPGYSQTFTDPSTGQPITISTNSLGYTSCTNGQVLVGGVWTNIPTGTGNSGTHGSSNGNGDTSGEYNGSDGATLEGNTTGGIPPIIVNWPLVCEQLGTQTCTRSYITQQAYQTNCRFENASTHSGNICDTRYRNVRSMAAVSCAALYSQCTNTTPTDARPPLTCIDQNLCGPNGNLYHQNSACVTNPISVQSCSYGCTESRCKAPGAPVITAFTVKPTLVKPGDTVSLTWTVEHAASCTLTDSVSHTTVTGLSGRETSEPITSQTVFTLTCIPLAGAENADGTPAPSISDTRTVSVVPRFREI